MGKLVISFLLTLVFWALLLHSFALATVFIVMLAIHECGHYLAFRKRDLPCSKPIFTPLGALINIYQTPDNAEVEAYCAFAGPLIGSIGALICFIIGYWLGSTVMLQGAWIGFWLNLFNLIPVSPMDGGRISMAINRRLYWLGIPLLMLMLMAAVGGGAVINIFVLAFIYLLAVKDIRLRKRMEVTKPEYFDLKMKVRVLYTLAYLALGGFLTYAVIHLHKFASLHS